MKRVAILCLLFFACAAVPRETSASSVYKITVLGDTLVTGLGIEEEDVFTHQLQAALEDDGYDVDVKNAAVALETTESALSHFGKDVADMPDMMIIALGMMDAVKGVPLENTERNLSRMLAVAQKNEIAVLLVGVNVPPMQGRDYPVLVAQMFKSLAEKYRVLLYPNFTNHVIDYTTGEQKLYLLGEDELHPNGEGVAVQVEGILPYVKELIKVLDVKYQSFDSVDVPDDEEEEE